LVSTGIKTKWWVSLSFYPPYARSIIIAHANCRAYNTAKALPLFIPELRRRGYQFVTVSELLKSGKVITAKTCYELKPGDNKKYDRLFGKGTE